MRIGAQCHLPGPAQHLTHGRVAVQPVTQHHDIDEKADQAVEFGLGAPGHRGADRDVGPLTGLVQGDRDGGLQQHELGDTEFAGQSRQPCAGVGVDGERQRRAFAVRHRRAREVRAQPVVLRQARELFHPVVTLGGDALGLAAEQLRLPRRVIGVLHRQRREVRLLPGAAGPVGGQDVGEQHTGRPVVGGDVMHHQRQHMLVRRAVGIIGCRREHRGPDRPLVLQVEAVPPFGRQLGVQPLLADAARPPDRDRRAGVDDLVRRTVDLPVGGAQDLVPVHHIGDRRDEGLRVVRSAQARSERNVVDRVGAVDTELEPLPQLGRRHLPRTVVRDGHHGRPVGATAGRGDGIDVRGDSADGAELEDILHPDVHPTACPYRRDQLGGQQRMSAEFEERVIGAHGVAAEQLAEQLGDLPLGIAAGFAVRGGHDDFGFRQRFSVDLAVRGDRDLVDHDIGRGDHVLGQGGGDASPDPVDLDATGFAGRRDIGDQALTQPGCVADHDDGLAHRRVHRDRGGHLTEFDPEAADLDLLIGAADEFDVAVGVTPGEVTGAVHPHSRVERVGDETLGGHARSAMVAVRDMCSTDVDLADHPDRDGLQVVVEKVHGGVDLRGADRHDARPLLALDLVAAAVEHRLGGPVEVVQQGVEGGMELVGDLAGQRLAADRDTLQRPPFVDPGQGQEQPQQRRDEMHRRDALGAEQVGQVADIGEAVGFRDDQAGAGGEHAEDLTDGHVEALGSHLEQAILIGHLVFRTEPGEILGDRPVRHRHTLGQAGRAGGVDQVSGVLRQQRTHPIGVGGVGPGIAVQVGAQFAQHDRGGGVGEDVVEPVFGVARVDRQVHRTGLHDAEGGDDQLGRFLHQHRDAVFGPDSLADQLVRQPVRCLVDLTVAVVATLVHHGGHLGRLGRLLLHQRGQGGRGAVEPLTARHRAHPLGVRHGQDVQPCHRALRVLQRAVQQYRKGFQHARSQVRVDDLGEVLGLHHRVRPVPLDHEAQRQLGDVPAQVTAAALHPLGAEATAVGFTESEAHPRHPLGAVTPVWIEFPHHPIQVDALVGEGAQGGVAGVEDQLTESSGRLRTQPHGHRVAVVADGVVGAAVEDRAGHQEVIGVGVAVDQHTEGGEQHHVRGGPGLAGQHGHLGDSLGRQRQRAALGAESGRDRRSGRPRKLQRLGRIGEHGAPVRQILVGGVGCRGRGPRRGAEVGATVGRGEIGEEHPPAAVVPGDVVGDEQHHVLVGSQAHQRDPQRRVGGQVEAPAELPLGQYLQAQAAGPLGHLREVVQRPPRGQVVVQDGPRFAVLVGGIGGAQHRVPACHRVQRGVQPAGVQCARQPVGQADVQQHPGRVERLHEPHPALAVGQCPLIALGGGVLGQAALGEFAAHQFEAG